MVEAVVGEHNTEVQPVCVGRASGSAGTGRFRDGWAIGTPRDLRGHNLRPSHSPKRRANSITANTQAIAASVQLRRRPRTLPSTNAPRPSTLRIARVLLPCDAAS